MAWFIPAAASPLNTCDNKSSTCRKKKLTLPRKEVAECYSIHDVLDKQLCSI